MTFTQNDSWNCDSSMNFEKSEVIMTYERLIRLLNWAYSNYFTSDLRLRIQLQTNKWTTWSPPMYTSRDFWILFHKVANFMARLATLTMMNRNSGPSPLLSFAPSARFRRGNKMHFVRCNWVTFQSRDCRFRLHGWPHCRRYGTRTWPKLDDLLKISS